MDRWFDHVEAAIPNDITHGYIFIGDPNTDWNTFKIIKDRARDARVIEVVEGRETDRRSWVPDRVEHMVTLRNLLLADVRGYRPEYFLSLDSDVLLHPDGIRTLIDAIGQGWDAVGGKCYLSPGRECPNYAVLHREKVLHRPDAEGGLFPVDVLMAVKLMSPAAYAVNYTAAKSGEDEGWSTNCRNVGLKLAWDSRVVNKHVMQKEHLDRFDKRVGF